MHVGSDKLIDVKDNRRMFCHDAFMSDFIVHTLNTAIAAEVRLENLELPEDALAIGVRGAADMLLEEIIQGSIASVVEVTVQDEAGKPLRRVAVSLSVAPLALG